MNIRFPSTFQTPAAVQDLPGRVRKLSGRTLLILGIAAVAVLGFIAWRILGLFAVAPPRPIPPVLVVRAALQDMPVVEHTIGTVVANSTVQITARVQGQLMRANFTEGQIVHKGDVLFQLDPRPYQAAYASATASLASAKAKYDRYARLLAQKAIAPQDADDAKANYLEASAAAETARLNLEYTRIVSPIDGKTGTILIQPGNMVSANGTSPLVVITQIQPVKISFALPQADLPRIQERARANSLTAAIDTHGTGAGPIVATVDFVGNAVNNQTGTIELRATYANSDSALVPGQLVDINVTLDALKGVVVVPHEAVNLGPSSSYVYIVKDGKAEMRLVKVLNDDGRVSAIQGDVKPGDFVITDGQLRVVPGKPVSIVKPGADNKPASP